MVATPSQLLLLADHIKLSLLERQRAISLRLQPNSHDGEISRSLDSLQEGIEKMESVESVSQSTYHQIVQLRQQYDDLYSQFTGSKAPFLKSLKPNDPSLASDFSKAQSRLQGSSIKRVNDTSTSAYKSVRFTDTPEDVNRAALLPYKDDPNESAPNHSMLDNQQIHEYHSQVIRDQDAQLDVLGESIGRTRHISIQIGNELDEQIGMLDEVDEHVDRHQTTLDRAQNRLKKIATRAKDNLQLTIIFILIIILVLLIVVLK